MDREGRGLRDAGCAGVLLFVCGTAYACATDETPAISPAYVAGLTAEAAEASNPLAAFTPESPLTNKGPIEGIYIIGQGETLTQIAQRLGVSLADLAHANGITDLDHIDAGGSLRIPGQSFELRLPDTGHASNKIEIKFGDTLSGIAAKYNTTVPDLMNANNLFSDEIYAGEELALP